MDDRTSIELPEGEFIKVPFFMINNLIGVKVLVEGKEKTFI